MEIYERYSDWWEEALDDYEVAELFAKLDKYSKACFFIHRPQRRRSRS